MRSCNSQRLAGVEIVPHKAEDFILKTPSVGDQISRQFQSDSIRIGQTIPSQIPIPALPYATLRFTTTQWQVNNPRSPQTTPFPPFFPHSYNLASLSFGESPRSTPTLLHSYNLPSFKSFNSNNFSSPDLNISHSHNILPFDHHTSSTTSYQLLQRR